MFEPTTPFIGTYDQTGAGSEMAQLRGFAWPELVARLTAARDFRSVLGRTHTELEGLNGGNFVDAAGTVLRNPAEPGQPSERAINLVGLSGSKASAALCADTAIGAVNVDREAL